MNKEEKLIDVNLSGKLRFKTNEDGFITGISVDGIDITTIFRRLDGQEMKISLKNKEENKNE